MTIERTNAQLSTKIDLLDASAATLPKEIGFEPSVGTAGNVGDMYIDASDNFYIYTGSKWVFILDASVVA